MVIQHNLAAMNSHRNLGLNNAGTAKNLEKLSSGFKINRAGDDAAGLAISEKMRGQIRGLAMAEQNVSNGVSLIQTAEGGLNETHAILQRMRELAVQSANGTYDEGVDRVQLDKEFQAVKSEIDRIAESTHYNGIKLLDGSLGGKKLAISTTTDVTAAKINGDGGVSTGMTISLTGNATAGLSADWSGSFDLKIVKGDAVGDYNAFSAYLTVKNSDGTTTQTKMDFTIGKTANGAGTTFTGGTVDGGTAGGTFGANDMKLVAGATPSDGVLTFKDAGTGAVITVTLTGADMNGTSAAGTAYTGSSINNITFSGTGTTGKLGAKDAYTIIGKGELEFQIGANGGSDQMVGLSVGNMNSKNLGLGGSKNLIDASVATQDAAKQAIDIITEATNQVSGTRADLGALQNRLEHTLNNLGTTKENLTAAESTIRDVDMAKEMMDFTKNQILVQASQAMLAQANQLPQGVLQLLR